MRKVKIRIESLDTSIPGNEPLYIFNSSKFSVSRLTFQMTSLTTFQIRHVHWSLGRFVQIIRTQIIRKTRKYKNPGEWVKFTTIAGSIPQIGHTKIKTKILLLNVSTRYPQFQIVFMDMDIHVNQNFKFLQFEAE
jgi:hypothetical protein